MMRTVAIVVGVVAALFVLDRLLLAAEILREETHEEDDEGGPGPGGRDGGSRG